MLPYLTLREQLISHQTHNVWPAAIVRSQSDEHFAPKSDTCPYSFVIVSDLSAEKYRRRSVEATDNHKPAANQPAAHFFF